MNEKNISSKVKPYELRKHSSRTTKNIIQVILSYFAQIDRLNSFTICGCRGRGDEQDKISPVVVRLQPRTVRLLCLQGKLTECHL